MYKGLKISLVIPAYNEQKLIKPTLLNVPKTIDRIIVVDDCSTDKMPKVVKEIAKTDLRILYVRHSENKGVGQAIITGYMQSVHEGYDVAVVIGGDNQMDLADLPNFLEPIHKGEADYVKGNRFMINIANKRLGNAFRDMPAQRFFGNTMLSILCKFSSGYWKIFDTQDGYTAITKQAIESIDWENAWKGYGYVGDWIAYFNLYNIRIKDVPRKAIYLPGERQSQIKILRYIRRVYPQMIKRFFERLIKKHLLQDFHPMVFFYAGGLVLLPAGFLLGFWLLLDWLISMGTVDVSGSKAVLCALFLISGMQLLLFAIQYDMNANEKLQP